MKRVVVLSLCILLFLSGCKKNAYLKDGIALELYTNKIETSDYNCYYLQERKIIETEGYMPCYNGGTPRWVRERVGNNFEKTGHEMYQEYGQLDDYYIDEHNEIYLYNKQNTPEILWFRDGNRQSIQVTIETCRQIQVKNEKLYLIGLDSRTKDGYDYKNVEKIDLETGEQEWLEYRMPHREGMAIIGSATTRINSDESFFFHLDTFGGGDLVCLSFPDGRCKVIESSKETSLICLVMEFADGYGILETLQRGKAEDMEDFYLYLRYFDREGNEIGQKQLDCSKMISASERYLQIGFDAGATFYDGKIYLALEDGVFINCFKYDIDSDKTEFLGRVREPLIYESKLVLVKENCVCTLYETYDS